VTPTGATGGEVREHDLELRQDRDVWTRLLLGSKTLPAAARLVGLVVAVHSDASGREPAWCSLGDLLNQTGLSMHYIRYALDRLQREHWLVRAPGKFTDLPASQRPLYLSWPPEVPQ
jgi:hypothetical protein